MVKVCGSTAGVPLKLKTLSAVEVCGIYGVAVKCIDTIKNTNSEGSILIGN